MTKRIAFISEHASPLALLGGKDSGGQNVYVAEVAKELVRTGYKVDVFTRKDDHRQKDIEEMETGIRVIHIEAGPDKFIEKEQLLGYMPTFADNMHSFIVRHKMHYDLVHAHFFMSALVASIIKHRLSIPYVVTFHALGLVRQVHQKEQDKFPRERFDIERFIVKDADRIIAECPQDKQDLVNLYNADPRRINVVPCGYSIRELHPVEKSKARALLGLAPDAKIVMHIGRMVARKGVDNIIHAFGLMKNRIPGLQLVIVGGESDVPDAASTPEIGRLRQLAQAYQLEDKIHFAGRKSRKMLKYYYSAADVFITTPWYEPFGITPLEAMACGIPVIGSNVGGIKYSVKHGSTGLLVPPKDPHALAANIVALLSDEALREKMCKNALKRVNSHFTWSKVADDLVPVYQKVVLADKLAKAPVTKHVSLPSMRDLFGETITRSLYVPGS
jgi:glycosyltransferase involved in cell wall biosynthesis